MVCVYCHSATRVINSRPQKRLNQVWRRRYCTLCGSIFTTHELLELSSSLVLMGPSGRLQPINRDLLFISIYECCKHRPLAAKEAAELTRTTLSFLQAQVSEGMLRREQVVNTVLAVLERFDNVAATMYRAYHPSKPTS